jgi:transcriptional regulator with XRE-family HTH domain
LTFAQRTFRIENLQKILHLHHYKPFPLVIKTPGDALIVRRKQAGLSLKAVAAETGIKFHWLRRWESDLCVPPDEEWTKLRKVMDLPEKPSLIIAQTQGPDRPQLTTISEHLRQRRIELELNLKQAAQSIGVSACTLGYWERGSICPTVEYHGRITAFLGYNPFP